MRQASWKRSVYRLVFHVLRWLATQPAGQPTRVP